MDIGTVLGILIGTSLIVVAIILGGATPVALFDVTSVVIVFGGSMGAMMVCFPLARLLRIHKVLRKAMFTQATDPLEIVQELVRYAEVARREGILALENLTSEMKDPFIVRGVKMAVDGTDPELIKGIMETDLETLSERHQQGRALFEGLAKYAPAFGMIGTLMGLIFMLRSMDDPSKIGPGMAVALITTLYGALLANIVFAPIADKLAARDAEETLIKTMIITGVMAIQSGDNPRVVESKLLTFLPPSERDRLEQPDQRQAA